MSHLYTPTATETASACTALTTRQPSESARYARAAALVRAGAVGHDADGWTVASEDKSHPIPYRVTPTTCGCADHKRTGARCKHLAAMTLYAHVLGAKLNERLPLPPEALYLQLLARGEDRATAAAITDDYNANPGVDLDPAIFTIISSQPDQRHVYARADGAEICTVRRVVLCGGGTKWVPHTAADTLGWATWLGQGQDQDQHERQTWRDWQADAVRVPVAVQTESPYKIDVRNASRYGHAPVAQLQHEAAERRRAAQA